MGEGSHMEKFKSKEKRNVSARININMSQQHIPPLNLNQICAGFMSTWITCSLFFLNCHCEGAVIEGTHTQTETHRHTLSQRLSLPSTLPL